MRTLFCQLEIRPNESGSDIDGLLEQLAEECWNWAKYGANKELKQELPEEWKEGEYNANDQIKVTDIESDSGRLWRLSFTKVGTEDPDIRWANHIYLAYTGDFVEYSILQEALRDKGVTTPFSVNTYPPAITKRIVQNEAFKCSFGDQDVDGRWQPSNDRKDVFDQVVSDSRRLPLILMSKKYKTGFAICKPEPLARKLSGIAKVVLITDRDPKHFNEKFAKQFVYNGAIRIHWPNKTENELEEDSEFDSLYTPGSFSFRFENDEDKLIQAMVDKICIATVPNFNTTSMAKQIFDEYDEAEAHLREEEEENERQRALEQVQSEKDRVEYYRGEFEKAKSEISPLMMDNKSLEQRLESTQDRIDRLEKQYNEAKVEANKWSQIEYVYEKVREQDPTLTDDDFINAWHGLVEDDDDEETVSEFEFKTIHDALSEAKNDFGSRITILDEAMDSANNTLSDAPPMQVYDLMKFLYHEAWPLLKKGPHKGPNRYIFETHIKKIYSGKYAPQETKGTKERFGNLYNAKGRKFRLKSGGLIEIYQHMKFGSNDNPLRIYLCTINESSNVTIYTQRKQRGKMRMGQDKQLKNHFSNIDTNPRIVIGWCGDHLPLAR